MQVGNVIDYYNLPEKTEQGFRAVLRSFQKACFPWLFVLVVVSSGCAMLTTGSALNRPTISSDTLDRKAWLSKVEITDPRTLYKAFKSITDDQRSTIEESLTLNVLEYITEGNYFKQVSLLPGEVSEEDIVMHFQFERYRENEYIHPCVFPVGVLTATLYIWFGGPLVGHTSHFSGTLIIEDSLGSPITQVQCEKKIKRNQSLYSSPPYMSTIEARSGVIKELLEKAIMILRKNEGKK